MGRAALLFALVLTAPFGASAQPSADDLAEARALYRNGLEDVEQGRWADALRSFERSYALAPVAATLFNLATTLRALGRHRDARDAFDRLVAEHSDLDAQTRARAAELRAESAARVAILALTGLPETPRATIQLDGSARDDDGARPLALETDPGDHTLRVELPEHRPFSWRGSVTDGVREEIAVRLEPEVRGRDGTGDGRDDENGSTVWYWIAGGAALVVAGLVTWVLLENAAELDPTSDNVIRL